MELVDITDLKSVGCNGRGGSSPPARTKTIKVLTDLAIKNTGAGSTGRTKFKLAAAVVYKNNIIATGVNSYKTHQLMSNNWYKEGQYFLHAEVDAIKNALKLISVEQLTKCELYIVRVKRPGSNSKEWIHGLAKPCKGCEKLIASFGINKVFYTVN